MNKVCLICKNEFRTNRGHNNQKHCPRVCYFKSRIGHLVSEKTRKLIGLKNSINLKGKKLPDSVKEKMRLAHLGTKNHFYGKHHSRETIEKLRNDPRMPHKGENHGMWSGGKYVDTAGYVQIWKPDHPFSNNDGYVREHRLVAEKYLGRYLDKNEIIHHINKIKSDNRLDNLYLFPTKEHSRYERLLFLGKISKEQLITNSNL